MKQSSFLVSVLATASVALLVIGIGLGIAIGYNGIEATNETTGIIRICCTGGIFGLAITVITTALQCQPKTYVR